MDRSYNRYILARALSLLLFIVSISPIVAVAAEEPPPVLPWLTTEPVRAVGPGPEPSPVPLLGPAPDHVSLPPPPPPEPPISVKQLIKEQVNLIKETVDNTHAQLEYTILQQTIKLDDFFGSVNAEDQQETGYQLRWRNTARFEEGGKMSFGSAIRANIVLSKISERLRLIVSGEQEPGPFAPSLPEDPGTPGLDRIFRNAKIVNTELRYGLLKTKASELFLGAGVRLELPVEAFARTRFQYTHTLSNICLLRLAETLFINNTLGVGETTEFSLERSLNKSNLLRWSNTGTVSESNTGVEFGSELSWISQIDAKKAITFTGGIYGNTAIDDTVTNFRIAARYRQNFLRSWLFYELEPEISWPRMADDVFPSKFAFMVRLEVLFQGTAAAAGAKTPSAAAAGHPTVLPR